MKKLLTTTLAGATAAMIFAAAPAQAAVVLTSTPGTDPYSGPTPTFNFDSPTPEYSGPIFTSSAGTHAQPYGSTGGFIAVGPADGMSAVLDLSGFGLISTISFIWGSVDDYNTIDLLDTMGNSLYSFTGTSPGLFNDDGDQTDPFSNPLATFTVTGADQGLISGLRFSSTQNAFEVDNVSIGTAVGAVPEPATWAMLILGFGLIGGAMRRRGNVKTSVSYA